MFFAAKNTVRTSTNSFNKFGLPAQHSSTLSRGRVLAGALGIGSALALSTAAMANADASPSDSSGARSTVPKSAVKPAASRSTPAAGGLTFGGSDTTPNSAPTRPPTRAANGSTELVANVAPAASRRMRTTQASVSSPGPSTAQPAGTVTAATPPYFPAANWLWKPIPANPVVAADSATWVGYLSAAGAQHSADLVDYGVTLVQPSSVTATTPRYAVTLSQKWGAYPFGTAKIPIPSGTRVPPGSDGQIAVLDPITGMAFGLWQAKYDAKRNTWAASWGGSTPLNGNGVDTSGSATGAGLARYAGVIGVAEFSAAVAGNTGINHALVFSTDIAAPRFVGPAIKSDGVNLAGVPTPIPEGYRVQLDPSINVDAIPGITPAEKVIAKTLQTYGAYVIDNGGSRMAFVFQMVPGATAANPGTVWTSAGLSWDYFNMSAIPWSKLRVLAP